MAGRSHSISARDISNAVQAAVKARSKFRDIKAFPPSEVTFHTPILGFVIRDPHLADLPVSELDGLAHDVAARLDEAKGHKPATFIHDGRIILGFVIDAKFSAIEG